MPRLRTDFWVAAYLNQLRIATIPAFVTASGEPEAGSVLIRLNLLDGYSRVFQRSYDLTLDRRIWMLLDEGGDDRIDQLLQRQRDRDRDLWIIEVEDREGRTLLDQHGLV